MKLENPKTLNYKTLAGRPHPHPSIHPSTPHLHPSISIYLIYSIQLSCEFYCLPRSLADGVPSLPAQILRSCEGLMHCMYLI